MACELHREVVARLHVSVQAVVGTLNSRPRPVQVATTGTVRIHLVTRSVGFPGIALIRSTILAGILGQLKRTLALNSIARTRRDACVWIQAEPISAEADWFRMEAASPESHS